MITPCLVHTDVAGFTTVRYIPLMGSGRTPQTAVESAHSIMPFDGSISNLHIAVGTAIGGSDSRTFTLYKNGSPTAMTATITGNALSGSDDTNSVSFSAGDRLSIGATATVSVASQFEIYTLVHGTTKQSLIVSSGTTGINTGSSSWLLPQGGAATQTVSAANATQVCPTGGTFKHLYFYTSAAIAAGKTLTVTLYINGNPTALTCTLTGDGSLQSASDTSNSVSITAGDTLYCQIDETGTPAAIMPAISMEFDPTLDGESIQMRFVSTGVTSADNYLPMNGGRNFSATESDVSAIVPACTIKKLYVILGAAPTGVKTRTVQMSKNASPTSPSVTITGAATTGNDTSSLLNTVLSDVISYFSTATGAPGNSSIKASCVTLIKSGAHHFFPFFDA